MASLGRRTDSSLERALFEGGFEFEFFQVMRLLARLFPGRRQVGGSAKPTEEVARFAARVSLAFPASAVHDVERPLDASEAARVTVAFMGLAGVTGVLPTWYTEWMLAQKSARDNTAAAFFDLFNHRFVSLFYRAWEKHRPPALYEAAALSRTAPDKFTHCLFDLIGMGTGGLRGRMRVKDQNLLLYAGLIGQRPHSAAALRGILRHYFSVPVEIDQFLGNWYTLSEGDRCYLSEERERNQLGEGAFIGAEIWNQQARFRVRVGPVGLERFREFLPGGRDLARLAELTRYIVGLGMLFDVQIFLRAEEVPGCRLSDEGANAPRLGWMGWLKTQDFRHDAGDAVFTYVN